MNLKVGSRLNVPGFDKWQGVVVVRNETDAVASTPVPRLNTVTLRYVTDVGDIIDQTFPADKVLSANPTPVDVAALLEQNKNLSALLGKATDDLRALRARRVKAARKKTSKRK